MSQNVHKLPFLKGQCHKIFDLYFFQPIWAPDKQAKMFFFYSFSRRYFNLKFENFDSMQANCSAESIFFDKLAL